MAKDDVGLLSQVPLFGECSGKDLKAIAGVAKEVTHEPGDVIAREGDRGLGFFLIKAGTARVTVGGRTRGKLGPGDFFGEISLLDEGPRTATVTAETPMTLLGVTAWNFKQIVQRNPTIARKLLKVMADRLRNATKDLSH